MSTLQTFLLLGAAAIGLYLLIVVVVVAPRLARRPRYRVGQRWSDEPVWWTANPRGARLPSAGSRARRAGGARVGAERGGARGSW